jgi:hypothetical protein
MCLYTPDVFFCAVLIFGALRKNSVCVCMYVCVCVCVRLSTRTYKQQAPYARYLDYATIDRNKTGPGYASIHCDRSLLFIIFYAHLLQRNRLWESEVFWYMTPCWLVKRYQRFGELGAYWRNSKSNIFVAWICRQHAVNKGRWIPVDTASYPATLVCSLRSLQRPLFLSS